MTRRILAFSLAIAAAAAFALPAAAQTDNQPPEVVAPVTTYIFKGQLVEGDKVVPDGTYVSGDYKKKTSGLLIRVRRHFVPQMLVSVQDI